MRYTGSFDAAGQPYPQVQFETGVAGSEFLCNTATGGNCTGANPPSVTSRDFGRDAQYGHPDLAWYGGTLISAVRANPGGLGRCPALRS